MSQEFIVVEGEVGLVARAIQRSDPRENLGRVAGKLVEVPGGRDEMSARRVVLQLGAWEEAEK